MANVLHKVRRRFVDPLSHVLHCIEKDNVEELKGLLVDVKTRELFQARLLASKAEKDQSPIVISILKSAENCFKYIVGNHSVNLEQETSAVIEGGYPVAGATPLWTASTLGKLSFVKELVGRGADIDHTTQSKSSPLRGAAFDGHCDVCKYLIELGADIDKPNQVGQSPLTIAAAMRKVECVNLLIAKGANVKHRGHNGDTPLHVCVESGSVEIAKILVKAGALNCANDVGFTPAILACCYGHAKVMAYLEETFNLAPVERYNCHCLLAAKDILSSNYSGAEKWLNMAVAVRQKHRKEFANLPKAHKIYAGIEEPARKEDVAYIMGDETRMFYLSAIICERVLGKVHPTTAFYIRIGGDMALAEKDYAKSLDLWQRSLEFDEAARMAYELQIIEDLLFCVRGFSIMAENGFIPNIEQHFNWGLREYRLAHDSKISENDVVFCLARMLATWIKVADHIKDQKRREAEDELIHKAGKKLIEISKDNPCPLLVSCLQNLPTDSMGAAKDIACNKLPLNRVLSLLLEMGCQIQCEDAEGNFPLHLAARLQEDSALCCVRTLLEYGAHVDAVNHEGKTALGVALALPPNYANDRTGIIQELEVAGRRQMSLQCISARAVLEYRFEYHTIFPHSLNCLVSWHEKDSNVTASEKATS